LETVKQYVLSKTEIYTFFAFVTTYWLAKFHFFQLPIWLKILLAKFTHHPTLPFNYSMHVCHAAARVSGSRNDTTLTFASSNLFIQN